MALTMRRICAWTALVTFSLAFGLGVVTAGHLGPEDDAACAQPAIAGHPRVQFETAKAATAPAHCPFCHWQRAVGGADPSAAQVARTTLHPIDRVSLPRDAAATGIDLDAQLSRGPPTA